MNNSVAHFAQRFFTIQWIVLAFIVLASIYSVVTPIFEAPDEMAHFAYIKALVDGRGFPALPIVVADDAPAQESSQPPLYYLISALAVKFVAPNTADFSALLERNRVFPYVNAGTLDGNKNIFVPVDPQSFPYRGATRAIHVARLVAVLLGALAVAATYGLGREVAPGRSSIALMAAVVVAFIPQFIFTSAAVSNDSAAAATCALGLWLMVRSVKRGYTLRRAIGLGIILALAALSKASALTLIPLAGAAILAGGYVARLPYWSGRRSIGLLMITMIVVLAIAGPWYARSQMVFGDVLGIAPHLAMPWTRTEPISFGASLADWQSVVRSFWLAFGWGVILAPEWVYLLLNGMAVLGVIGVVSLFLGSHDRLERFVLIGLAVWVIGVALELFRWNQLSNAALGRLAFPAISAVGILLALGWSELSSWRLFVKAKWVPALFPAGLIMLSIIAEPVLLSAAFALPRFLTDEQLAHQPGHPIDIRYGNVARLVRIDVPHSEWPHPGETSAVRLCWDALAADPRELLVVVQFVGPADQVVAVRRMHPGLGNYPTRLWQSGARFCDEIYVPIQPDAPAPAVYDVDVGFFDQQAYQRLPTYAANNAQLGSNFVERVKVAPRQYTSPTIERELNYRLGDQIELIGYALDPASIQPGESIHLRLYWRALRQPDADYTVFAHVRDAAGNIAAQLDSPPQLGAYPTSFWDAGEIVTDDRSIQIAVNARAGDYTVNVGLYRLDNGERLPVTSGGSGTEIVLPLSVNVR